MNKVRFSTNQKHTMKNTTTNTNAGPATQGQMSTDTTDPKAKLTSHTDARGNVWFTITRGDETLLETRDEDAANQMATDLDIMSCEMLA